MEIITNINEIICNEMLSREEPFIIAEIAKKFDIGRDSITKYTKWLKNDNKLFKQSVGGTPYFISVDKMNPSDLIRVKKYGMCRYGENERVYKKICQNHCNYIKNCSVYYSNL